jgi:hypothetical protein
MVLGVTAGSHVNGKVNVNVNEPGLVTFAARRSERLHHGGRHARYLPDTLRREIRSIGRADAVFSECASTAGKLLFGYVHVRVREHVYVRTATKRTT